MLFILLIGKHRTAELVDPAEESFLAGDKIHGQDQSDKDIQGDIPDPAENIHRHVQVVGNIGDHDLRLFLQICRPVRRIQVDAVILGEFVEVLQLIFYVRRIVLRIIHKVSDTVDHLREYQPEEQAERQKNDRDRYDDGKRVAELRLLDLLKCFCVEEHDQKVDQIGNDRTDDDRRYNRHRTGKPGTYGRKIIEDHVGDDPRNRCDRICAPSVA